jgi:Fis family transcriptional regulator
MIRARKAARPNPLAESVARSLEDYFRHLDGEPASGVYEMVINNVERALLADIMSRAQGNQTLAADMLGLNRNTLRSKLKNHGLM